MELANKLFFAQVEEMLTEGREVQLRIKGYSMRPLLRNERDTVVLRPYRGEELKIYDVVLFRSGDHYILHRIVHRDGENFTLAGDGNYKIQEHCKVDQIRAVMYRVIRPNGRIVACDSWSWRIYSRCWCSLPAILRRYTLAMLSRISTCWQR
ncbi:MAG: S26 family signal peptidase [Alistipes sp.]